MPSASSSSSLSAKRPAADFDADDSDLRPHLADPLTSEPPSTLTHTPPHQYPPPLPSDPRSRASIEKDLDLPPFRAARADNGDGDFDQPLFKAPRTDANGHYAGSKRKSAGGSSTRTGQACDRCKLRKIRCDARPGGCSPCLQNNSECKTTDRITGRATSRGHTEQIESENTQLKMYMIELQQQLRDSGVEPKPPPALPPSYMTPSAVTYWSQQQSQQPAPSQWGEMQQNGASSAPQPHDRQGSQSSTLPIFRAGCIGDNYLGVSSENGWLSPIEGTSLSLFGTKIDLAEFMPPESDPVSSAMSYRTFLNLAYGRTQPFEPPLPPYQQCKIYSEWYFRSIQTFIPILHKPDYMKLLDRMFNEGYTPTPAETVMVHMVLAVINFQFSARNNNDQARHDSMNHYHFALTLIPELVTGHKLDDIQALTMICSQLRNLPRPGPSWMFTNMVMGLAIESGLHRSAKAWRGNGNSQDPHHLEMRKRVFWSLLMLHVHISGKLGRPMPLRKEDFDIEIPEPASDNTPDEPDATNWKQCSWRSGYQGFKLLGTMMKVYSSIYSIKSTGQYETNVVELEKELDDFHASIPPELRGGAQTSDEDCVSALYLDINVAECQLLLHHPSLCRSSSPQLTRSNLDTCLVWSSKLLETTEKLKALKSLDTTWYFWIDILAAIFTTLFASTERRDQMTSEDLQRLQHTMDRWMSVTAEASTLLGTGPQLQAAIKSIIDHAMGNINRHIAAKTASAAVASTASPTGHDQSQQSMYDNNAASFYPNGTSGPGAPYMENSQGHHPASYGPGNQFNYPPTQDTQDQSASYSSNGNITAYDASPYSAADSKPNIEAQLVATLEQQQQPTPTNYMGTFHSPTPQDSGTFQQPMNGQVAYPQSGAAAWRHFADAMVTNVSGQDYMHSAGALMALSGGKPTDGSMDMASATMGHIQVSPGDGTQQWPLMLYNGTAHQGH